ncbi:Mce-associated membrane protein [Actinomycetospora succinea]|uniref:Mce-associated membrane protein n=1 Tax=Actinomycetospora succinea TaxID=663603 RepID=A0A4R6UME1_9PSEU|nr:hypothetical protein [Actinomycetospora succinea]TDQ47882.1 Mce-associated membrane protein [Actinomycetospora succinea]
MPPRSRTKPGATNRRPKVAGLRQHAHAGAGAPPVDDVESPEVEDRLDAPVETQAAAPVEAPVETPTETAPVATTTEAPETRDAEPDATPETTALSTPAATEADTPAASPDVAADRGDDAEADDDATDAKPTVATTVTAPRTNRARRGTRMTPRAVPAEDVETAAPTRTRKPARTATQAAPQRFVRQREALGRFAGSRALPITLVVAIVVCLVLGGLAFWKGREAWTTGPVSNQAVIDVGGTAELVGQSREAIEKIFSYDFSRLDDSADAARTMSTGQFADRYMSVFDQTIRQPAQQQQLRQTATVVNIGVTSLTGDRATLMALTQFSAQRTTTGQSTNAPGLLRLDMERVDGRWKLAELTPLTANR